MHYIQLWINNKRVAGMAAGDPNRQKDRLCGNVTKLRQLHPGVVRSLARTRKLPADVNVIYLPAGTTLQSVIKHLCNYCKMQLVNCREHDNKKWTIYKFEGGEDAQRASDEAGDNIGPQLAIIATLHDKLANDPLTDFEFVSRDGTKYRVHKFVLCVRSNEFLRIFSGRNRAYADMRSGTYPMKETGDTALKAFVQAIYTGKFAVDYRRNPDSIEELLHLSQMYGIHFIKRHIESELASIASRANAHELAKLAGQFELPKLGEKLFAALPK